MQDDAAFEAFWRKFLSDHPSAANRWAHVAALAVGAGGLAWALRSRALSPLLLGGLVAGALATGGHPIFQGDLPKNFANPSFAARAFLRLCARTVSGEAAAELARIQREELAAS
jgi:hypothetical protein